MKQLARRVANLEFWLLWVLGVPLLLASNLPHPVLWFALLGVPGLWLARRVARGSWSVITPLDLPLLVLAALGPVAVLVSGDWRTSLYLYAEWLGGFALYSSLANSVTRPRLPTAVWLLLGLGGAMAALGVLGLRTVAKLGAFIPAVTALPHLNVTGLNPQGFTPNIVAGAIAPLIPLGMAWGLARPRGERAVAWLLAAGMSVVLVLTESRGALLGVALALLVMVLWKTPWSARLAFLLALLTVSVVGLAFGIRPLDAMLATDSTGTVAGRLELWDRAVMILRDFSFTGVGLGGYERIVRTFYPLFQNSPGDPVPHAHNMYLQMGVDFGAGGLVALLGLITTAFMTGTANVWQTRAQASQVLSGPLTAQAEHWLALGLLAALVVIAVHGLLDAVWLSTKVSVVVWYLLGLIVALNLQVAPKMDRTGPGVNYVTGNI